VTARQTGRAKRFARKAPVARVARAYVLRLFVAGATVRSRQAVLRVRKLCAAELKDDCTLEVIDIYQQPHLARANQIVATPTLIKDSPRPVRRFIGNLANIAGLLDELAVNATGESTR
jgi:circadian clock protein KaiB